MFARDVTAGLRH